MAMGTEPSLTSLLILYAVEKSLRVEMSCSWFIINSCILLKNLLSVDASTQLWASTALISNTCCVCWNVALEDNENDTMTETGEVPLNTQVDFDGKTLWQIRLHSVCHCAVWPFQVGVKYSTFLRFSYKWWCHHLLKNVSQFIFGVERFTD